MNTTASHYYVPASSYWPLVGSVSLFALTGGSALALSGHVGLGSFGMGIGFVVFVTMLCGWFGAVIGESQGGRYNDQVDVSFRWGMAWFILSEVMFFAAFFGALFYVRQFAVPWLGGSGDKALAHEFLWPSFVATWPLLQLPDASQFTVAKHAMAAAGLPAVNTLILLSSGATVTWAHWGLKAGNRRQLVTGLWLTVGLGTLFLGLQAHEYWDAYTVTNLRLTSGIYGSTFYMLTGFHGAHVLIGTIMLGVVLARSMHGHFTPTHHFAFEAASWYWHFVDVVWLGLFVTVYLL
ncbi:cytochrome c oxidase subunit 3 [Sulfuritalea hydrogenivorans]|uniref:cytochrome-c oxidase n=1 Tax=Sulfuritalea hydrogenivorans sk43H TaxID=1223802 RepID=W0SF04_9PROT|nr:cytochrome c oxidase subunit 3 [Sulfuritalea hydrogenivorans]BAO29547.1 cytochrome c oxidase subunit III [Sulfuritalea hydrogenivorans sk43H]